MHDSMYDCAVSLYMYKTIHRTCLTLWLQVLLAALDSVEVTSVQLVNSCKI